MGSLRRKSSIHNFLVQASKFDEEDTVLELPVRQASNSEFDSDIAEIDCGYCTVFFSNGASTLLGLGSLEIKLCGGTDGWRGAWATQAGIERLATVLSRVLANGVDFLVTYDFRDQTPGKQFITDLARFCEDNSDAWTQRVKASALLVRDNIFDATAQGPVRDFVTGSSGVGSSPFVVCHSKESAHDFFRTGLDANGTAAFVSVVAVQALDDADDDGPVYTGFAAKRKNTNTGLTCLASLAPMRSQDGAIACCTQAHMFHTLPNGDMRVIQSPCRDVVLGAGAGQSTGPRLPTLLNGRLAGAKLSGLRLDDGSLSADGDETPSTALCAKSLAALKFKNFQREHLQKLVGANFHMGELIVDADCESRDAHRKPRLLSGRREEPIREESTANGCMNSVRTARLLWKQFSCWVERCLTEEEDMGELTSANSYCV